MTDVAAHAAALAGFLKPSTFDWADESEELESPTFSPPIITEDAFDLNDPCFWELQDLDSDEDIEGELASTQSYDSDKSSSPTPPPSPPRLPSPVFLPQISLLSASLRSQDAFNWSDTTENETDESMKSNNIICTSSSYMDESTNFFDGYDASQLSTDVQSVPASSPQHFLRSSRYMSEEFEGYEGLDESSDESRLNVDAQSILTTSPNHFLKSSSYMDEEFEGYEDFNQSYDESRLNVDAQSISTTNPRNFLDSSSYIDEQTDTYKSYEDKSANTDESYHDSRLKADAQSVLTACRKRLVKSYGYMNLAANAYDSYEDDEAADAYDSENEDEVLVAYEIYKQDEGFLGDDNHDHSRVNVELSKDEPCDDDDADEDTQSLPDSLGSNDAYHEEPYPPRHKSPNYRQEVQRYIPSAYDAELKWQDQNYHYWPGVHHFNWWGQPVFHRSPSLPEESLAVLHATPKSFDDDDDLTKWVLLKNAQRGLDPVVVDRVDKKAYNDLMTLRGSALQHAAKGRVWRAYSEYGSWRFDGEDENELNAPDFAEMTLNLSPGVKVINGFLENGYARSRKGYICRLERDRKINADTATNSRWAPLEESEAAGRVYIKRRDWIPETRSPLQKVETLSPLQTPGPFETWSALETASPIETLNSIETSSSLETSSVLELPATTSPLQKVETPDILEKLGQIEMASILETSSVLEIPATRSPLQKVETPDILENLGQIQTQSALDTTSPIETSNPMETSSSLETLSALEILEVRSPLQKVETPDILENLGQIQTPSALETSSALNTPPKRTLRRTAKQQQLRPTPLPALGQPKKLGKTAGKASANATTGPVDTSRDPDIYFSFPTPKIKKKNKIKRFFVKTWQVFRDGLSPKE